ncbi:MAG: hypothetical protein CVU39_06255 [Chloroflexi bacterium HGW-Chloroflexi-10]|nr:MAG: hypothetical protein CVU39_06255 [Chloroflexi bacterium HGW-Chloroflexi-10]
MWWAGRAALLKKGGATRRGEKQRASARPGLRWGSRLQGGCWTADLMRIYFGWGRARAGWNISMSDSRGALPCGHHQNKESDKSLFVAFWDWKVESS